MDFHFVHSLPRLQVRAEIHAFGYLVPPRVFFSALASAARLGPLAYVSPKTWTTLLLPSFSSWTPDETYPAVKPSFIHRLFFFPSPPSPSGIHHQDFRKASSKKLVWKKPSQQACHRPCTPSGLSWQLRLACRSPIYWSMIAS